MPEYRPEDLELNIAPVEVIRRLWGQEIPTAAHLVMLLVHDLCLVGAAPIAVEEYEGWWLVSSYKDWLLQEDGSVSLWNFSHIAHFPQAGREACHSEILLTAFADVVITRGGADEMTWIVGDPRYSRLPTKLAERISRLVSGRCIVFRMGNPSIVST
jgi:hypothetical protein